MAKIPKLQSNMGGGAKKPLPSVNVDIALSGDLGSFTPEKMRSLICNPIYTGVGPYPALIDEETWVRAAVQMIKKEGAEQFLVNMLYVLRKSLEMADDDGEDGAE